jgi:hypothetical protein
MRQGEALGAQHHCHERAGTRRSQAAFQVVAAPVVVDQLGVVGRDHALQGHGRVPGGGGGGARSSLPVRGPRSLVWPISTLKLMGVPVESV